MEEVKSHIPERLFHYTSINSLASILHYQTLRFTKLSKLNDPLEGRAGDLEGTAKQIFCSSWSSLAEDTIPMWKMYSELAGVRLEVSPFNMFKDVGEIQRGRGPRAINYAEFTSDLAFTSKGNTKYRPHKSSFRSIWGPDPVQYDEPGRSSPATITGTAASIRHGRGVEDPIAFLDKVGLSKPKHWEFENEVRFRLAAYPIMAPRGISLSEFCEVMEADRDNIDVPLSDDIFKDANVLLGPLCEPAHEILVQSLIEKYAPSMTMSKSEIQMVIP